MYELQFNPNRIVGFRLFNVQWKPTNDKLVSNAPKAWIKLANIRAERNMEDFEPMATNTKIGGHLHHFVSSYWWILILIVLNNIFFAGKKVTLWYSKGNQENENSSNLCLCDWERINSLRLDCVWWTFHIFGVYVSDSCSKFCHSCHLICSNDLEKDQNERCQSGTTV